MQQQIQNDLWWKVEGNEGTYYVPAEYFGRSEAMSNYPGQATHCRKIRGWGARLSAPGYMDCTEWCVFKTKKEAKEYIHKTYGED